MPRPGPVDVTREVDRLYTLPLAEFTAARDDLLKRLRALGAAEAADHVRRLRRPTITAWVVNRLAREEPEVLAPVLDAGASLRGLHEDLLSGQAVDMPTADRALSMAIADALGSAERIAGDDHGGPALVDRLRRTLRAAALDPQVGELVRAGRLDRERDPPVLGLFGAAPPPPPPPSPPAAAAPAAEVDPELVARLTGARERLDRARETLAVADARRTEARRSADEASARAEAAQVAARRAAGDADEAEARRAEAERLLREAEAALAAARSAREAAEAEASRAEAGRRDAHAGLHAAEQEAEAAREALRAAEDEARRLLGG